jgi:hypothetical protein
MSQNFSILFISRQTSKKKNLQTHKTFSHYFLIFFSSPSVSITPFFSYLFLSWNTHNISRRKLYKCIKYLVDKTRNLIITVHQNSLSWDITYPYLLNISNDSNHCVYCAQFYMFTMRRAETTTHTFWWKFYHALCSRIALFACCIYHCRIFIPSPRDVHMEHRARREKRIVWWLKNTRPVMAPPLCT